MVSPVMKGKMSMRCKKPPVVLLLYSMHSYRLLSAVMALILALGGCSKPSSGGGLNFLLLAGASGGPAVSPPGQGAGQVPAKPTAGTDLENPTPAPPPNGSGGGGPPAAQPPAPPPANEDTKAPRLLRIEWPRTCKALANGYERCDDWNSGPVVKFDEAVDCASLPHVEGGVIRSPGAIKVYEIRPWGLHIPDDSAMRYSFQVDAASIPAEIADCVGNQARIVPVTGAFAPGGYVVVITDRARDLAGNALVGGAPGLPEAIGDRQSAYALDQFVLQGLAVRGSVNTPNNGHATGNYRPFWADTQDIASAGSRYIPTMVLSYTNYKQGETSSPFVFSQDLDCPILANSHLTGRPARLESIDWDAYRAGGPFASDPVHLSCAPGQSRILQFTDGLRAGRLYRLTLDGSLGTADGTMTMGFGKYRELTQQVNGAIIPVPREFPFLLGVWPENAYKAPVCEELTVTEPVTYFDTGTMHASCDTSENFNTPLTTGPAVYSVANHYGFVLKGACVQYTGPAWQDDQKLAETCRTSVTGMPPAFVQPEGRYSEYSMCDPAYSSLGEMYGTSFLETGVVGVCIQNPGKARESVVYFYDYDRRVEAKAACKGLWRERGAAYALAGSDSSGQSPAPGVNRVVSRSVCPSSDGNVGGSVTARPPTGKTCPDRSIEIDTTGGRWFNTPERSIAHPTKPGKATRVTGIHTYWGNEPLKIRVKNNCQAGYYKLQFKGMNVDGPLPSFYGAFALAVRDEAGTEDIGAVVLNASDSLYSQAATVVYLEEGNTTFDVRWQNDAYKKGEYDANLNLNGVTLSYQPTYKPTARLGRNVREACAINGRFFYQGKTAWTSWANQQLAYCYRNLPSGRYWVTIQARNHGTLPSDYKNFEVLVAADGVSGNISVPASADAFKTGKTILDLRGGEQRLVLSWTNDTFVSDTVDSAIEIQTITLKRIGDSQRSALTAFLSSTAGGRRPWMVALAAVLISLGGLLFLRWKTRSN